MLLRDSPDPDITLMIYPGVIIQPVTGFRQVMPVIDPASENGIDELTVRQL